MSERLTSIWIMDEDGSGIAEWGRVSVPEMIQKFRLYAERKKREAEMVLNALDSDFRIETYRGVHVKRDREVLQEGKK